MAFIDESGESSTHVVEDHLRICPDTTGELHYDFFRKGYNDHACGLGGVVRCSLDGTLVLIADGQRAARRGQDGHRTIDDDCYLRVETDGETIAVTEIWPRDCELLGCDPPAYPQGSRFEIRHLDPAACASPYRNPLE